MYRSILIKNSVLHKLGMDAVQLRSLHRQAVLTDLKLDMSIGIIRDKQYIMHLQKGLLM
jgi:LDH2 family malate/lactate/ureidoglycolate dehydrogenase